ncbi:MAG: pyridoxamine 5'-phosphate oxidase family protein [Pseudomonadota bacterium]
MHDADGADPRTTAQPDRLASLADLEAHYGAPVPRSITKELPRISPQYAAYIARAPFAILSTVGPDGVDCSPRGDPAGFARVADPATLLIPDRPGNNRLDSLRNIVRDPRVAWLFLVPGVNVTMRVIGRAHVSIAADLLASFEMNGKRPKSVIVTTVDAAYFQCPKALVRSQLWNPDAYVDRAALPSTGEMLAASSQDAAFDAAAYDAGYAAHMARTIY